MEQKQNNEGLRSLTNYKTALKHVKDYAGNFVVSISSIRKTLFSYEPSPVANSISQGSRINSYAHTLTTSLLPNQLVSSNGSSYMGSSRKFDVPTSTVCRISESKSLLSDSRSENSLSHRNLLYVTLLIFFLFLLESNT